MLTKAASYQLVWDMVGAQAVDAGQQWILSAMSRHGPALLTMLWRILGNEQDVCDTYQDTFLQLAHCRQGQKPEKVKAYLFRTAGNTAISILRRKLVHDKACREIAQKADQPQHIDYAGDMDVKYLKQLLRYHITQLPDYLRAVVVLHDLAELPYLQVAKMLEITPASARVHRRRAVKLLAAYMTGRKVRD